MTLHLHRAARTDALADGLGALLAEPLPDPFAADLVVVPAKGVERWLSQRLSHRLGVTPGRADGICAGVEFRSPRSLVAEILGTSEADPWAPDALVWPLLEVVDGVLDEPWAETLARHLGHFDAAEEADLRRGRRFAVAARLARLYAAYAVQRPTLLADWESGDDTDGAGAALDDDLAWQAELWRLLVARVTQPTPDQRHRATITRLRDAPDELALPARLSLFGHTRLPVTEIALLQALAAHRDVHLWLPQPSDGLWRAIQGSSPSDPEPQRVVARSADRSHEHAGQPLLATLARDSRELARSLTGVADHDEMVTASAGPEPTTLLGWLQSDLRANSVAPAGRRLAVDDRSVQIHACHGAARQVEVLREVLLGLLADDPTLEPRDIVVMCPDIETYAPLINAAFGLGDVLDGGHPAHGLRVRLADRALTQTNPLLGVAARLVDLAGGRATASEVLDLLQSEPVRFRFGLSDDDLDTITTWVRDAGVRWALDREHRAPYGLEEILANTWQFGLDRVLTGVALSDDARAWLDTALPLDDVGSNRIETAGRLAEFVSRLRGVVTRLEDARVLADWIEVLVQGVALLARPQLGEEWQTAQVRRELGVVLLDAADRTDTEMRLPDVRALLERHLAGRPTRANFRTGSLTVCTMVPMRSVPHRVVCLLGMDDGVVPRQRAIDGDDVLARAPRTGERDVRSEDRQLLLDAVLAAGDHLVITYTGANEYTNQPRPPAVPIGELLDALDRTTPEPARERIVVAHPLQSFDLRNVAAGALGTPGPFSFDPTAATAARAATATRTPPPPFVDGSLPERDPATVVALDDLLRFYAHPVRGFFAGLDLTLPWEVDGVRDAMPVDIDQLEKWSVGDRMLRDMLAGLHPDAALQTEWRRGTLPPGRLGWRVGQQIRESAMRVAVAAYQQRGDSEARSYDVDVVLDDGRRLVGTVGDVYGSRVLDVGYSRMGPKQRLASWIRLVALSAAEDDGHWTAICIGRRARGDDADVRQSRPLDDRALGFLSDLVRVADLGRRYPLALPLKTGHAWASAVQSHADPRAAAERHWKSGQYDGEDADPAVQRAFGERQPLDALLGPPRPGEEYADESTRLGALARRVFEPMFAYDNGAL